MFYLIPMKFIGIKFSKIWEFLKPFNRFIGIIYERGDDDEKYGNSQKYAVC